MRWLNYHHLIYFRTIATAGSISEASKILKIGQPALSSQLKQFEESLGAKLFDRVGKKLLLTEIGHLVLEYGNKIHDLGQDLITDLQQNEKKERSYLRVGALDNIPKHLICDIVDFAHKKTKCYLSIFEGNIDDLMGQLESHQLDLIITDTELNERGPIQTLSKKILQLPLEAYGAEQFLSFKKGFPSSLNGVPCILPTSHSRLRRMIESYFLSQGVHLNIIAETQDTSLQKILAAKGDGVIFLPRFAAKEFQKENKLHLIAKVAEISVDYFLVYRKKAIAHHPLELVLKQNFQKMRLG